MTRSPAGGTSFGIRTQSSIGTGTISAPRTATILPKSPWPTSQAAAQPRRVASTRSNAVGVPPRWTCPRTVARTS